MKSTFNRTKLVAAMAVVLGASGAATPALAVNLSDNGLGEFGMVPYYTVRNNIDTNISVVNTSRRYVVAFKIRFRESDNSRDARDFNVFLSPNDVWTATVTRRPVDDDPANDVPVLVTGDQSCTLPILAQQPDFSDRRGIEFTEIAYDGSGRSAFPGDGGDTTIERAQEGHVEIIAMGVADPNVSQLASWAVHGATQNCADIQRVQEGLLPIATSGVCGGLPEGTEVTEDEAFQEEYCEPLNVLKVAANLIRVDKGVAGGLPVTMLANFFNPELDGAEDPEFPGPADIYYDPGSERPDGRFAFPPVSAQITEQGPVVASFFLTSGVSPGADAVSSLFMATDVINEYAIGGAGLAQNAWVITFPTKNFYVDSLYSSNPNPFQEMFDGVSCVTVDFDYYDREEAAPTDLPPGGIFPSPRPIGEVIPEDSICQEVQTLNFGDSSLLGSANNYQVPLAEGYTSGWMRLGFPGAGALVSDEGEIFNGLPVMGFAIKSLENGVAQENLLNYGIVSEHAYRRVILDGEDGGEPEPEPEPEPVL